MYLGSLASHLSSLLSEPNTPIKLQTMDHGMLIRTERMPRTHMVMFCATSIKSTGSMTVPEDTSAEKTKRDVLETSLPTRRGDAADQG